MKRFLIATALTASLAGTAYAATEAEIAQIEAVVPNVDASALTDAQVATAMNVINGTDSRSAKMAQLSELFDMEMPMAMPAELTEAQRAQLDRVAPGIDYSTVTQAQADTALLALNGGMSEADTEARVKQILMDDGTPVGTVNTATSGEMAILERYMPADQVAALTEAQLNTALAVVYSGGGESEIQDTLESMFN